MQLRISGRTIATLAILATFAVACNTDSATAPDSSVTAGLSKVAANDTSSAVVTPNDGPGYFHGTVLGPSAPGTGNDSLNSAPRIAGVTVTIYPGDATAHGPAAGSTTTDASGLFQLPTLPAGQYLVTFVPPASSAYSGVYAFGPLRSNSKDFAWWVVLPKK